MAPSVIHTGNLHQIDLKTYNELREHIQIGCQDESF